MGNLGKRVRVAKPVMFKDMHPGAQIVLNRGLTAAELGHIREFMRRHPKQYKDLLEKIKQRGRPLTGAALEQYLAEKQRENPAFDLT